MEMILTLLVKYLLVRIFHFPISYPRNNILLTALMVASTRFQKLFTPGSGYTLFMPALVKVYVEAAHPGIRTAIEYDIGVNIICKRFIPNLNKNEI